jgi:two-component system chemotaxis response regulator CheY
MASANPSGINLQVNGAAIGADVGLKVMIVDDQAAMRRIVRQLLASNGIRDVLEASDGAQALEQLQKPEHETVDLVICDLMMPGMDGLTFCNQMRRDIRLKSRHVPILLLTAVTDELVLQVARQVGALDIANKPIAASELGRRIEHLVGIKLH